MCKNWHVGIIERSFSDKLNTFHIFFFSDILKKGGSAADAAIATLFCEGIACPQSMGLGGGFVLTIYTKSTGKAESLIARDVAPIASNNSMFVNDNLVTGPLAITVPGELKGYWELHKKYGVLPWAELVQPSIELCHKGHLITNYLSKVLLNHRYVMKSEPSMAEIFINPKTGDVWKEGDRVKRLKLAETLEIIAKEGADTLYTNGTIAQRLMPELKKLGTIITLEDFLQYKVRWRDVDVAKLKRGYTMYAAPFPASGSLLTLIMNILNGYTPVISMDYYHYIVESFKFAYAERSNLGDESSLDRV